MKNALKILFVIAILLSGYLLHREKVTQHDLLLLNVEALSRNETGYIGCDGLGSVYCPISPIRVSWVWK